MYVWRMNVAQIDEHNTRYENGLEKYRMGMNQWTHLTTEELESRLSCVDLSAPDESTDEGNKTLPVSEDELIEASVDWRTKVTPNWKFFINFNKS